MASSPPMAPLGTRMRAPLSLAAARSLPRRSPSASAATDREADEIAARAEDALAALGDRSDPGGFDDDVRPSAQKRVEVRNAVGRRASRSDEEARELRACEPAVADVLGDG